MSNTIKAVIVLGLVTLAACAQQEEQEVVVLEPVMEEPVSTKY